MSHLFSANINAGEDSYPARRLRDAGVGQPSCGEMYDNVALCENSAMLRETISLYCGQNPYKAW